MTADRRAALVEKTARLFAKNDECPWEYFTGAATAAIDLALEEAALVADRYEIPMAETSASHIAAAIRALKEERT